MADRGSLRGLLVIALLALGVHAGTLFNGFVFDDVPAVLGNPVVHGGCQPLELLTRDFWGRPPTAGVGTWRPLAVATFCFDRLVGGGAPWAFHLSNLIFHALTSVLLTVALTQISGQPNLAWLAGALFALLGVNTEAVAAVVGRADVMAVGFSMVAWATLGSVDKDTSLRRSMLAGLAYLAALFCKEAALVFPVWSLLIDLLMRKETRLTPSLLLRRYLGSAAALIFYLATRYLLFAPLGEVFRSVNNNPLIGEPFAVRLWTGCKLFLLSLQLSFLPLNLSADYSYAQIMPERLPTSPAVLLGALALLVVCSGAWHIRRRAPLLASAAVLFMIPWLLISNISTPLPTILGERLLYAPACGLALALAWGTHALQRQGRVRLAAGLISVIMGLNAGVSVKRGRDWHDDIRLFYATVQTSPHSARAWTNLGAALIRAKRPQTALTALTRALGISPQWAAPHTYAGVALDGLGQSALAEQHLRRALELDSSLPAATYNLAIFLARRGQTAEASSRLRTFLQRYPGHGRELGLLRAIERGVLRPR